MTETVKSSAALAALVRRLAESLLAVRTGKPITLLPIMTGAMLFCADLARHLPADTDIKPIYVQPGQLFVSQWKLSDAFRDLWVVDNTICSGTTLANALKVLPETVRSVVLFGLLTAKRAVQPTLIGEELPHKMVGGYGADVCGKLRGLPELARVEGVI